MSPSSRMVELATDERGAVLVMFAVFAPVAILLAAFAIDTGNWFLHKRHLQVQADAGALAAAREFQPCIDGSIYAKAGQYGGVATVTTPSGTVGSASPLYNQQTGGPAPSQVHELINSKKYYGQAGPIDSTADERRPCEAEMVDVKITQTDLPWYWRAVSRVPYINAHARVEIQQETSATKVEPLAIADTAPVAARAYFVDEDNNNSILAQTALSDLGPNSEGQEVWGNSSAPLAVAINHPHVGVVIALSGNKSDTTCGHPYVECFGRKSEGEQATLTSAESLLHIAGYANAGTGTLAAPLARQVSLSTPAPDTCTDGYFSTSTVNCTVTLSAKVDYGSSNRTGVTVTPVIAGKAGAPLTFDTVSGTWIGVASLSAGTGSNEVSLLVKCKKETTSACPTKATEATIKDVQRAFAAGTAHSGTIKGAWISEIGGSPKGANSFEVCEAQDGNSCTHKLVATVDVAGSLANAAGYADAVHPLRWEGGQGVRIGCPPPSTPSGSVYRERLEKGCPGTYKINTSDPNCTANASPYECLSVGLPGKDTGPTRQGIDARIEHKPGTRFYCPNNWQNNNGGGVPVLPKDDSRIVEVFVMPYGSVNAQGQALLSSGEVPIQTFAAFYVTGFPGDGCKSDPSTGDAEIVGHFIKYISTLNNGGGQKCALNSLGECVAVLTR